MLEESRLVQICVDCLVDNAWYVGAYAGIVLLLWLSINYKSGREEEIPSGMLPTPSADLPAAHLKALAANLRRRLVEKRDEFLNFFKHENLQALASSFVHTLEWVYGIRGNYWDFARSFKAALVFYFVIIPLPAAFMPPVGGIQIAPSAQLMVATVILIFANAIGDMFSVNCSVKIIRKALNIPRNEMSREETYSEQQNLSSTKIELIEELKFYGYLFLDLIVATSFLILVLMISSVMYGVQIGEFGLSSDKATLLLMWDSAWNFDRLFGAFYWFANDPTGFLGQPGIPGMLVFSLTTFFPTLLIGLSAFIWVMVLPIRILISKEIGRIQALIASQACVFLICLGFSVTTSIDVRAAYALITTT